MADDDANDEDVDTAAASINSDAWQYHSLGAHGERWLKCWRCWWCWWIIIYDAAAVWTIFQIEYLVRLMKALHSIVGASVKPLLKHDRFNPTFWNRKIKPNEKIEDIIYKISKNNVNHRLLNTTKAIRNQQYTLATINYQRVPQTTITIITASDASAASPISPWWDAVYRETASSQDQS